MEIVDRQITHEGKILEFGNYHVVREINRGANGIVYEAEDKYLQRKVAIKVWTKLRPHDKRDKIEQGIAEARKAYNAQRKQVIEIYHAGVSCGVFFVVMEYFAGVPVKQYVRDAHPPLGRRVHLASAVLGVCYELHEENIFHGDLHSNNILLLKKKDLVQKSYGKDITLDSPQFKIIDFGTSHFAHQSFSEKRYFNQLISFANELSEPFSIQEIYGYAYPNTQNWELRLRWILQYNGYLPKALFKLGYIKGEEWLHKSLSVNHPIFPVPEEFLVNVEKLIKTGIPLDNIDGWDSWELA